MKPKKKFALEKKPNPNVRSRITMTRFTMDEFSVVLQKAKAFCGGNVSEWLRLAAVKFSPR